MNVYLWLQEGGDAITLYGPMAMPGYGSQNHHSSVYKQLENQLSFLTPLLETRFDATVCETELKLNTGILCTFATPVLIVRDI